MAPHYLTGMGDFNGDGKQDIVAILPTVTNLSHPFTVYVAFGGAGCTLGPWQPQSSGTETFQTAPNERGNYNLVIGDYNGDGVSDLAILDIQPEQSDKQVLYYKLANGSRTSNVFADAKFYDAEAGGWPHVPGIPTLGQWSTCARFCEDDHCDFRGAIATDVNGDGRQDLVAGYSSRPYYEAESFFLGWPVAINNPSSPVVAVFSTTTAMGNATGLATPWDNCSYGPSPSGRTMPDNYPDRYPFPQLLAADVNGDGKKDLSFSHVGSQFPPGTRHTSDFRVRFGASVNPLTKSLGIKAQDVVSGLFLIIGDHLPGLWHLTFSFNRWYQLFADVNGDGLDDWIIGYRGGGRTTAWLSGSPTMVSPLEVTSIDPSGGVFPDSSCPVSPINPCLDALSEGPASLRTNFPTLYSFPMTRAITGDFNGDGIADLARSLSGGGLTPTLEIALGKAKVGLQAFNNVPLRGATAMSGNSNYLSTRVADLDADGRDDVLLLNDDMTDASSARIVFSASPQLSSSGLPDLLFKIDNGRKGITTVSYGLTRELGAIQPTMPGHCGTDSGHVDLGASCGRVNSRPSWILQKVSRDNGFGYIREVRYQFSNRRLRPGLPSDRADLGFELVEAYDVQTGLDTQTWYRQDMPYQGLPRYVLVRRGSQTLSATTNTWVTPMQLSGSNRRQVYGLRLSYREEETYEANVKVKTTSALNTWNSSNLAPTQTQQSIVYPVVSGDNPVITSFNYASDDTANWLIAKPIGEWQTRLPSSGTAAVLLSMKRTTYHATKPWRVTLVEKLLFNSSEQTCTTISGPWNPSTCSTELNLNLGRWVTTFRGPTYSNLGQLLYWEDVWTPAVGGGYFVHPTTQTFDANYSAFVASSANALGQTRTMTHDAAGRILTETDPNGKVATYTYDIYGRKLQLKQPGATASYSIGYIYEGNTASGYKVVTVTNSSPTVAHSFDTYVDGFGRTRQTVDHSAVGDIFQFDYPLVSTTTSRLLTRKTLPYLASDPIKYIQTTIDELGRTIDVKRLNASLALEKQISTTAYNTDNSVTVTDTKGRTTRTYRDARGLMTKVTDAASKDTTFSYTTSFKLGQVTLPTGQSNNLVKYQYDGWGRKVVEEDPGAGVMSYAYDDLGNLTSKKWYTDATRTAMTRELSYRYDGMGRVITEGDPTTRVTYYYDEAAQQNATGRLSRVVDISGTTKFDYDGRGNIATKTINPTTLGVSYAYSYAYNDRNLITQKIAPDVTLTFAYSSDGVLLDVSQGSQHWMKFANHNASKQAGKRLLLEPATGPSKNTTIYQYDVENRITNIRTTDQAGNSLQNTRYIYDALGNITATIDNRSSKMVGIINTDVSRSYAYDSLNRLTKEGTKIYGYDALGNVTRDTAETVSYYPCAGKHCIKSMRGSTVNWIATHDVEGKRTRFEDFGVSPNAIYDYGYDHRGRLSSVTKDGVVRESFEYNYADERTRKVWRLSATDSNTITTWFVGDSYEVRKGTSSNIYANTAAISGSAMQTVNTNNGVPTTTSIDGQVSAGVVTAQATKAYAGTIYSAPPQGTYLRGAYDALGSPVLMTNIADGTALTRYVYDAWGNIVQGRSVGWDSTTHKFTDQQADPYSGLLYYGARYYHPRSKRFLTADDRVVGGGAQGYNRFAYVLNNPLRYVDPTGHDPAPEGSPDFMGPPAPSAGGTSSAAADAALDLTTSTSDTSVGMDLGTERVLISTPEMENGMPVMVPGERSSEAQRFRSSTTANRVLHGVAEPFLEAYANLFIELLSAARVSSPVLPRASILETGPPASPTTVELNELFAAHLARNNQVLGSNLRLAETFLSPAEYQAALTAPARGYGTILERMQARSLASDPTTAPYFRYVGGAKNPDWVGAGPLEGLSFDVTTVRGAAGHYARPYGENLVVHTYTRSPSLGF